MNDAVDETDTQGGTLLVDLGNTRIKWAWLEGGELRGHGASPWPARWSEPLGSASARAGAGSASTGQTLASRTVATTADEPCAAPALATAQQAFPGLLATAPRPSRLLYAPMTRTAGNQALEDWARRQWCIRAEACPAEACRDGLANGYAEPARLGADRWAAMLAAWRRVRGAVCVMDAGTAFTIDCIDAAGRHQAGYLYPGAAALAGALAASTGVNAGVAMRDAPGHGKLDTSGCLDAALLLALKGVVQGAWREFTMAHPRARLFATGGDAIRVAAAFDGMPVERHPHLVLEGLAARAESA